MKKLSLLVFAGLVASQFAQASVSGTEVPLRGGKLSYVVPTKPQPGYLAYYLTLNQNEEANEPTSMTLTEDTGIRCITTPCPSTRQVNFEIVKISRVGRETVKYFAVEQLKNIPPNVRIAPRRIELTESSMELVAPGGQGFMRRLMWEVRVKQFSQETKLYTAQPKKIRFE